MDYTAMDQYWIWLSGVEDIGPKRFYQLLTLYEDPRAVWDALGASGAPKGSFSGGRRSGPFVRPAARRTSTGCSTGWSAAASAPSPGCRRTTPAC